MTHFPKDVVVFIICLNSQIPGLVSFSVTSGCIGFNFWSVALCGLSGRGVGMSVRATQEPQILPNSQRCCQIGIVIAAIAIMGVWLPDTGHRDVPCSRPTYQQLLLRTGSRHICVKSLILLPLSMLSAFSCQGSSSGTCGVFVGHVYLGTP